MCDEKIQGRQPEGGVYTPAKPQWHVTLIRGDGEDNTRRLVHSPLWCMFEVASCQAVSVS